jgi:Leucine-rich repeat (LRR) protein
MTGIKSLKELRELNLSGNKIEMIDKMDCQNLISLNLEFNAIIKIENLANLTKI